MAIVPCRECRHKVSTEAASCPHCGSPDPAAEPSFEQLESEREEDRARTEDIDRFTRTAFAWLGVFFAFLGAILLLSLFVDRPERSRGGAGEALATARQFGTDWPFTVDMGLLRCERLGPAHAVTFRVRGAVYGVNGSARTLGYADSAPILKTEYDLTEVIDRGRALCE